jgi:pimeloyl-ACP methyl ester carboxylesterase
MFGYISQLIDTAGPAQGLLHFQASPEFAELKREYPDTAASLTNQFRHPRAVEMARNLNRIPNDSPIPNLAALKFITVPTLVLANRRDPIHPYEYGERLAHEIAHAKFHEIPSKSEDAPAHLRLVQQHIQNFLTPHFSQSAALR